MQDSAKWNFDGNLLPVSNILSPTMRGYRAFAVIIVFALIIVGAFRLRFDAEILNVLPPDIEAVEGLKLFQNYFPSGQELIVTVEAEDAETAQSAAEHISTLLAKETNRVASAMWRAPWQEHPGQAAELMAYLWLNQPPTNFAIVANRLTESSATETFRNVREQLATSFSPTDIGMRAYDPLSLMELPSSVRDASGMSGSEDFFASPDGKFRIVTVKPKDGTGNYRETQAWFQSIKKNIRDSLREPHFRDVNVHYTGRPAFVSEISGGMEKDMVGTSGGTLLVIGLLFYLTHRRIVPLLWLLFLLLVMLAITTALGGLVLGVVNVMSIGFASILVGLGEDFAIVLYQDAESHPGRSIDEIRREAAPGILWSALTAAGAFASLNFSSIPGLAQLGTFVAIGLFVAAGVMLVAYLPPLAWLNKKFRAKPSHDHRGFLLFETKRLPRTLVLWGCTAILAIAACAFPIFSPPQFDRSPDPLRPRRSEAYDTMALVKNKLARGDDPLWVVARGNNEAEVAQRITVLKAHLDSHKDLLTYTLPEAVWPNPENQNANRIALKEILSRQNALEKIAAEEGFTTNSMALTRGIFETWKTALAQTNVFKPANDLSRWVLDKISATGRGELYCLALVYPKNAGAQKQLLESWPANFKSNGIVLSGWQLVGKSVFDVALRELPRVTVPIILLVLLCLWLAFRDIREVALSVVLLVFSALTLNAVMTVLGWKWNLLNMMAIPMLLGMGVDFSIHMQLALRKSNDLLQVRRSVGKALLLAGATTVAGFGSLAFSSNAGMASLGKTCALGIVIALLTAVYLLPVWWEKAVGQTGRR